MDVVDELLAEWAIEQPNQDFSALGVVVRIQLLAKLLGDGAEKGLESLVLKHWEYDVLSALRRQGPPFALSATALAQASMLTSGTITTRIDGLEKRGLVKRMPCKADRRGISIRLTKTGHELVNKAVESRLATATSQLVALSPKQRSDLSAGLRRILLRFAD